MRKAVEDLGPKHEGAEILIGMWRGRFVDARPADHPWMHVELKTPAGLTVTVAARKWSLVDITPLPEVKVGDMVIRASFFRRDSRFYRQWITGEVKKIGPNKSGQILYGVTWEGSLDETYYVRSMLEKLDQETRDAALALLTEQEEQHA